MAKKHPFKHWDFKLIAILAIVFGAAEIVTGFKHEFFGIVIQAGYLSTIAGATLGLIYVISGIVLYTGNKKMIDLSILLFAIIVFGRIFMVLAGLFPTDTPTQVISIVIGTSIAALFGIYVHWRIKRKRHYHHH